MLQDDFFSRAPRTPPRPLVAATASLFALSLLGLFLVPGPSGQAIALTPVTYVEQLFPTGSTTKGAYAFKVTDRAERPARFDPCHPVHYVVNPSDAPSGAEGSVHLAMAALSQATGITFFYEGVSDEVPADGRQPYQPTRYGGRWAPVLIGWGHLGQGPTPDTSLTGNAVASVVETRTGLVSVSGYVTLNADYPLLLAPGFGEGRTWGDALLHELGHLAGLDHVRDRAQVMYPSLAPATGPTHWGAGDLAGLRRLGREAGCVTTPAPSTTAIP